MTSYRVAVWLAILLAVSLSGCESKQADQRDQAPIGQDGPRSSQPEPERVAGLQKEFQMSDEGWKTKLTPEQYRILREKGTEQAFTGKYWNTKTPGTYKCAGCGQELFTSKTKFDSGCGWPSFFASVDDESVATAPDETLGMARTEILCSRCGSHLGHVFDDGPQPTGLRYCVNSASLDLEEE